MLTIEHLLQTTKAKRDKTWRKQSALRRPSPLPPVPQHETQGIRETDKENATEEKKKRKWDARPRQKKKDSSNNVDKTKSIEMRVIEIWDPLSGRLKTLNRLVLENVEQFVLLLLLV